ncbi:uncharacterized protein LOC102675517 [Apis dorsata]|uniref:uncharacterized protein LOC102675517 n=1 Tax=Apis dorsata TaxID=7462 RepID=UPI0012932B47|nr:uncharacterized protein LOC102675517 [Apis dorsata]
MASGIPSVHQRKLGPAPIASFEDLSDEVENGEPAARMPGIVEVTTPATPGSSLKTPSTPRIDISRASSSSHHEDSNSRDSTPERELLAGGEPPPGCKLTLGYKEDAQDLRSSTEELDLQDPIHEQDLKRESKKLAKRRKEDGSLSDYSGKQLDRERKDSNCSEIVLLNISGRTSRLSSVGSQGSGASGKLSVVSATSSRSPSPHKCLLETSFCGSKPTLADNLIEPSKPETDDLEKILLKREADTTKALIPESIKVSMVDGNLKPDPLDKPRRRGREERKEIFKREVEITKRFLEKVNIQVPVVKRSENTTEQESARSEQAQEVQKPATLDFNDKRKKAQNFKEIVQTTPTTSSATGSPKLARHQKVRDLEGSRTPSPSSVSRKSSFTSLFKARTDSSVLSPESPSPSTKPRRSLTSKIRDTTESLRSRSKSRDRVAPPADKGAALRKESKNKGVFSSTLSLFKKRERKKSYDEAIAASAELSAGHAEVRSAESRRADLLDEGIRVADQELVKTPSVISDLDRNSSESERDSEIEFIRNKVEKLAEELPDERKGLFYEESFEEDLPYIPTTLPLEKSVAVPILPVKQRLQEVRTIPIERPRSTTPINPTLLDEFVMQTSLDERRVEKMKISLPREESFKLKSPRKHAANTFMEFAGKVPDGGRKTAGKSPSPPPLPPRATARPSNWINFEEIPEKRKAPKRIQTIPRPEDEVKSGGYSYVQPEECRCECHEESRRASMKEAAATRASSSCSSNGERACNGDNCTVPTSTSLDRASIVSDSSLECSLSIEENNATQPLSAKPFSMDLDIRSNRSSIVSQDETDETLHQ